MRMLTRALLGWILLMLAGTAMAANQTINFSGLVIPGGIATSVQWNGFQISVAGGSQPYMQLSSGLRFGTVAPNENTVMTVRRIDSSDFTLVSVRGLGLDENTALSVVALNNGATVGTPGSFPANPTNNTTTTTVNFGSIVVDEIRLSGQTSAAFAGAGELYDFVISVSNLPPTLNSYAGSRNYTTGGAAITLDGGTAATITDADSADFNGGYVLVSGFNGEVAAQDNLQVGNVGTIAVNLSTGEVSDSSVVIGQVASNGQSGADLRVNLNGNATVARVQNLIRALQYYNSELTSPYIHARTLQTSVSDGDGAAPTAYNTTINFTLPADPVGSQKVTFNSGTTVPELTDPNPPTSFTSQGFSFSVSGGFGAYFQQGYDFPGSPGARMGTTGGGVITTVITRTSVGTDFSLGSLVFGNSMTSNGTVEVRLNGASVATRTVPGGYAQRLDFGGITVDEIRVSGNSSNSGFFQVGAFDELIYFPANLSPAVGNLQGDTSTFTQGDAFVALDMNTAATLSDTDSPNFDTGSLTLAIVRNKWTNQDVLQIGNVGSISLSGNNVQESGTTIGTITGNGTGANNLVVSFNANATPARIQNLLRALQYRNTEANQPDLGDRSVQLTLLDGDGSSPSETSMTVRVRPSALPAGRVVTLNYSGLAQQPVNTTLVDFQSYRATISGGFQPYLQSGFDGPSPGSLYGGDTGISSQSISLARVDGADFFGYAIIVGNFNASVGMTVQTRNNGATVQTLNLPGGGTQRILLNDTLAIDQIVFSGSVSSVNGRFAFIDELAVKPPNTPPTLGGSSGNLAYTENAAATVIDSGLTVTDPDNNFNGGTLKIQITANAAASDVLSVANVGGVGLSGSNVQISGVTKGTTSATTVTGGTAMTITFNASANTADVQTIARAIAYSNNSDAPPTTARTVTFTVTDAAATFATRTRNIDVTAVNDPPTISAAGSLAYTENQAATPINSTLVVGDLDHATLASATITISTNYVTGQDVLGFVANPGTMGNITGTFAPATGILSLSSSGATATLAQWQAAVRAVSYVNTSEAPSTSARTVAYVLSDGSNNSTTLNNTITVTALNDVPVLSNSGVAAFTEDGPAVTLNPLVSIADIDHATLASATVTITANFASGQDQLGFVAIPGTMGNISGSYTAASGVLSLSSAGATATLVQWQEALRAITFSNSSQNPSTAIRGISMVVNDGQGNSLALANTVSVTGVNDQPELSSTLLNVTFVEDAPPVPVNADLQIIDVDSATMASATITVTAGLVASEDILNLVYNAGTMGNIVFNYNAGTGVMSLSSAGATATVAQWRAALRAVTYSNSSNTPNTGTRTLAVVINDGGLASPSLVTSVNVQAQNDPPAFANASTVTYTEGAVPVALNQILTIDDPDNSTLASASVVISTGLVSAEDRLEVITPVSGAGNIAFAYDEGTGTMSLVSAGATATLAEWQTALRAITYRNLSDNPNTSTRQITISANDGSSTGVFAAGNILIQAVNDPPVLSNGSSVSYVENALPLTINDLLSISDVDNSTLSSATVTVLSGYVPGEDVLGFIPNPGTMGNITASFVSASGTLNLSSAGASATLVQWRNALHAVTYVNTSDNPSTAPRSIQIVINDGQDNAPPTTSAIAVTAENDAPVLSQTNAATYTEGDPGTVVNPLLLVADADNVSLVSATVVIAQGLTSAEDSLLVAPGVAAGAGVTANYDAPSGTLSLSSVSGDTTLAQWQSVLRAVQYRNTSDNPSLVQRVLRFNVQDAVLASNQLSSTVSIVATNDAPVLLGEGVASFTENGAGTPVHASVSLSDVDNTTQANASITIAGGFAVGDTLAFTNDGLSMGNIVGSFVGNTMTLTSAGQSASLAEWQAALRAVTFSTSSDAPSTADRLISLTINDGQLDSLGVSSMLTVVAVNDAPSLTVPASLLVIEDGIASLGPIAVLDPDVGNGLMGVQFSVSTGQVAATSVPGVTVTGSPAATITATGTRADLSAWMANPVLSFAPGTNFFGSTHIAVLVSDLGNTPGPAATGSANIPATVQAVPDADLLAYISNDVSAVWVGETVVYGAVLKNAGNEDVSLANQVRAQFSIPSGLSNVSWTCEGSDGGVCSASGSGAINDLVILPSGGSVAYVITATVDAGVTSNLQATFGFTANPGLQSDPPANNISIDADEVRLFRNGFE